MNCMSIVAVTVQILVQDGSNANLLTAYLFVKSSV